MTNPPSPSAVVTRWIILAIMLAGLYSIGTLFFGPAKNREAVEKLSSSTLSDLVRSGNVQELNFYHESYRVTGRLSPVNPNELGPLFESQAVNLMHLDDLRKIAEEKKIRYRVVTAPPGWLGPLMLNVFLILVFMAVWWLFLIRPSRKSGGGNPFQFGETKAKLHQAGTGRVKFGDVAGCEEAKEDLKEMVEFLKNPYKFSRMGGKIPKGVLLYGPPGNGKTLLAKAVAGEAGVPFYSASASEFVEMFVGVGASRVRDLFAKAKQDAPCIVFIDELDAVGRHRFAGVGGGHDEREQTLNQLLIEMDGFLGNEGVILIGATNRPDVLDPALLRPGRFDRHVVVPLPNLADRVALLKVHSAGKKLGADVDLNVVARRIPGFSGADVANLMNEAALLATRRNKESIGKDELEESIYKIQVGGKKSKTPLTEKERKIIAYHESGHTLAVIFTEGTDPVHKVSIIPRGQSLGHTLQLPEEERHLMSKREMHNRLRVLVGGRVAEEILLGQDNVTGGACDDFSKATNLARRMVMEFGMGKWVSVVSTEGKAVNRLMMENSLPPCSEKRQQEMDEEIEQMLRKVLDEVRVLLRDKQEILEKLAALLLEKEDLDGSEVYELVKNHSA